MVAEQRGYTARMAEEPKDGVGLVKTIPRKRPQRRRVEMSVGLLVGSAANLEHPPLGGSGWDGTETDLKENVLELEADDLDEKIINDGVKVNRFKVRAWGGVHMSQSGQENPGARCGDKDSDIGRIDDEECVVKDWRHTHTEKQCQANGCNLKGERGRGRFDAMKAAMKWKGDGEKRTEWKVWKCTWYLEDGWWIGMGLQIWQTARWCRLW